VTGPDGGFRSLEDLEGVRWPGPPSDATRLIATAHVLRRKPVDQLSAEDLRLLISQDVGLPYLLPRAVELLGVDPMLAGDFCAGDLLAAVLTRDREAWAVVPSAARRLRLIVAAMDDMPRELPADAATFMNLSAGL
jgi:hypothetical protein